MICWKCLLRRALQELLFLLGRIVESEVHPNHATPADLESKHGVAQRPSP